ncbi:cyclin-P4-1-like [Panicum miliaceum]|uniref:Cyclin n=1 Tax=Panicum miliaceum TaxID=4540 RepID=A0A3L6SD20_PANMI|nr:cyclin-P4-1-like [Panicum miliaceum]
MTTGEVVEAAAVPRVVSILSALLQRVAERNDAAAAAEGALAVAAAAEGRRRPVSAFQGLTKPAISIGGYLERIFRFASCSPSCYVVAYIYLDRFLRRRPALAVDSFNVHRLLITSVLTAVKFVDDICYNNAYFARVGGISLVEMNYLEVDFLFGIAFDLNVTPAAFASYCSVLQSEMAYLDPPAPVDAPRLHCYSAGTSDHHHDDPAAAATAAGCHRHSQQQPQLTV